MIAEKVARESFSVDDYSAAAVSSGWCSPRFDRTPRRRYSKWEKKSQSRLGGRAAVADLRETHGSFAKWIASHHPLQKADWVKVFKKTFVFTGGEITGEFLMSRRKVLRAVAAPRSRMHAGHVAFR